MQIPFLNLIIYGLFSIVIILVMYAVDVERRSSITRYQDGKDATIKILQLELQIKNLELTKSECEKGMLPVFNHYDNQNQHHVKIQNEKNNKTDLTSVPQQKQTTSKNNYDLEMKRFNFIRSQKYNASNPYYQAKRPNLVIYPGAIYTNIFQTVQDVHKSVKKYQADSNRKVKKLRKNCPICAEHFDIVEILWNDYIKPRYYHSSNSIPFVGMYLEMGALDGVSMSNSIFFDQALHWKGLLIEPSPPNYADLLINRPHAMSAEVASCHCGAEPLYECDLEFVGNGGSVGGGIDSLAPREKKLHNPKPKVTYPVSCAPMREIFKRSEIRRIDFWSLDNEGAELITLQTVDWTAIEVCIYSSTDISLYLTVSIIVFSFTFYNLFFCYYYNT